MGADGPTHHGVFDLAYLRMIPNLVVAAPRDENQLQHLLVTGIESGGPFALRFPREGLGGGELHVVQKLLGATARHRQPGGALIGADGRTGARPHDSVHGPGVI